MIMFSINQSMQSLFVSGRAHSNKTRNKQSNKKTEQQGLSIYLKSLNSLRTDCIMY